MSVIPAFADKRRLWICTHGGLGRRVATPAQAIFPQPILARLSDRRHRPARCPPRRTPHPGIAQSCHNRNPKSPMARAFFTDGHARVSPPAIADNVAGLDALPRPRSGRSASDRRRRRRMPNPLSARSPWITCLPGTGFTGGMVRSAGATVGVLGSLSSRWMQGYRVWKCLTIGRSEENFNVITND